MKRVLSLVRESSFVVGFTVLLLVAGHFAIGAARSLKHALLGSNEPADYRQSSVLPGGAERARFLQEMSESDPVRVRPYYHWRRRAYPGRFIQVSAEGIRRTVKAPRPGARRVFCFGGSTLWGTGSPDEHTIPSELQKRLGNEYDVYNFGETGFVSVQELNLLLERLAFGDVPDVVIFYDGVNDSYSGVYSPGVPRDPQFKPEDYEGPPRTTPKLLAKLVDNTNYKHLVQKLRSYMHREHDWDRTIGPKIEANAKASLDAYDHYVRQARAIGREYGFKTFFFWQPYLPTQTKKVLDSSEAAVLSRCGNTELLAHRRVYEAAKARLSGRESEGIYFIGDLFNDHEGPVYFDLYHIGPAGNRAVAGRIYDLVGAGL